MLVTKLRKLQGLAFVGAAAFCFGLTVQAQISVGIFGSPTNTFGPTPALTSSEWATSSAGVGAMGSGTFTTTAAMDAAVQSLDQSSIAQALTTTTANGTALDARHNTSAGYLFTQPASVGAVVLKAALRNTSGLILDILSLNYDFGAGGRLFEELPGQRVYFSTSGTPGSWQVIPALSGLTNSGTVSATISVWPWTNNASLFLLWLDDNAVTNPEGTNTIDNFYVRNAHIDPTPITISNSPSNLTVAERAAAAFNVVAGGVPLNYYWFSNGVQVPGNNVPSFTIPSAIYAVNTAQIYVVVSNAVSFVTSSTATLTVIPDNVPPVVTRVVGSPNLTQVSVTFSEAMKPDTIVPGNFILYPSGSDPDMNSLVTADAVMSNGTNVTLTTEARTSGMNYSLRLIDLRDNSWAQNPINPNPTDLEFITQNVFLIDFDFDNIWRYSTETNLFSATGTGWTTTGYDDSTWPAGPAGLGVDTSANGVPIRTSTGYSVRSEVSFFRRHFTLPALTNGLVLAMRHLFEDGAVVWINGQEAGRYNVAAATPLTDLSRAVASAADPTPISGPVLLPLTNVFPGDNVIAVAILQVGATSADVEMALELMAEIPKFPTGDAIIWSSLPYNMQLVEGRPLTLTIVAEGALPITYRWRKNGIPMPGQTNSSLYFPYLVPPDAGSYDVIVSNSFNSVISTVCTVTVDPDVVGPRILSAIGETNLSVVTAMLHDEELAVDLSSANVPGNYQVRLTAGGPDLGIISAVATNVGTNTVLTLTTSSPRVAGLSYTLTINGVTDTAFSHNLVSPNSAPIFSTLVLFPFNHVWRYNQSGADLGANWKEVDYNDAPWPVGPGVLGFENSAATLSLFTNIAGGSGINTVLSLTSPGGGIGGTNVTFYFRTMVNLAGINMCNSIFRMRAYVDDGAILYVNGAEQFRYNMTNAAGYTNFADAALTEGALVVSNLTGFVSGNNVIAVEVHQNALTSADIAWSMQLETITSGWHVDSFPTLNTSRNALTGEITIRWACGGVLQETPSLSNTGAIWNDVPGQANNSYTFTPTPGTQRFFSLRQ